MSQPNTGFASGTRRTRRLRLPPPPPADAVNDGSAAPVNAGATSIVDQADYFPSAAPASTADDNLFFGFEMDLNDNEDVVANDHDVRIQAAIECMQADRTHDFVFIIAAYCCLLSFVIVLAHRTP
ncbi:hypothetical protein FPQ18DRAFT_308423 [Pyronema domesticum]|nr:hypothetical protein FPQ18DRAFT_308423 [Pyronema domesticum]